MIFLGINATLVNASLTVSDITNINYVKIQNGLYDDLYITKDIESEYSSEIPRQWDLNTILHALFQGNLYAGNFSYSVDDISSLIIKRRKKGDFKWITLFEVPIEKPEDFKFARYDRTAKGRTIYEYSLIPTLNNAEGNNGNMYVNEVYSDFEGLYILDSDSTFSTILDIDISTQKNKPGSVITTYGQQYPYVIKNGYINYDTGSVTATWIQYDNSTDEYLTKDSWDYRENLGNFLMNDKTKIIKLYDSRLWFADINDNISFSNDGHYDKIKANFQFTQIADGEDTEELYLNGFIDFNPNM